MNGHCSHLTLLVSILITFIFPQPSDSMIITSVLAGPKKYKTVSFDFLPIPLSYSVPNKFQFAYRGHYTFARPHFDVNMAMPVTLPMNFLPPPPPAEEEYVHESPGNEAEEEPAYTAEADGEHGEGPAIQDVPVEGVSDHPKNPDLNKYEGYESNSPSTVSSPDSQSQRPYTGKAQVSSFIDNGQFVNANDALATRTVNSATKEQGDAAFGDELPPVSPERRTLLKDKGKTISLGYETKGDAMKTDPISVHNRNPDSLPWGMTDYTELQKYYTTFTFTDQFRDPRTYYEPKRKKLLLATLFG